MRHQTTNILEIHKLVFWITHQKQNTPIYLENMKARQFSGATIINFIFDFKVKLSQNT